MNAEQPRDFVDIHCHILPGFDCGSGSWDESIQMARVAVDDGIESIIATPHRLGVYQRVTAECIRQRTTRLQERLSKERIPLRVLPGAVHRLGDGTAGDWRGQQLMSLADAGTHLLIELPADLFWPVDSFCKAAHQAGVQSIMAHPERNRRLCDEPRLVDQWLEHGCLLQLKAGSLLGSAGAQVRDLAEWMVTRRAVHLVASEGRGAKARRPLLSGAFRRVAQLTDVDFARRICHTNPQCVVSGQPIEQHERPSPNRWRRWLTWQRAA